MPTALQSHKPQRTKPPASPTPAASPHPRPPAPARPVTAARPRPAQLTKARTRSRPGDTPADAAPRTTPGRSRRLRAWLRGGLLAAAVAVAVWLVAPQAGEVPAGLAAMGQADPRWLALAAATALLAYLAAAVALQGAVPAQLCYRRTTQVQVAAASATAITPAGLASLALNTRYLERTGVPRAQALAAVAVSRLAALAAHLALLAALAPALLAQLDRLAPPRPHLLLAVALAAATAASTVAGHPRLRAHAVSALGRTGRTLRQVAPDRRRLGLLLGGSFAVNTTRAATLYACMRALGAPAPLLAAVGLFLAAEAAGALATTPAGLGVLDGVMLTGLAAFGIAPASAIAAVLLFRLLTFWAPILPGAVTLRRLRQRGLL